MFQNGFKFFKFPFKSKKKNSIATPNPNSNSNHVALSVPQTQLESAVPSTHVEEAASRVVQEGSTFRPSNSSTTDKALAATNIILQTLGYFASAAPIPGIKGVLQLVRSILGHIQNVRANNAELEDLIRQICFLLVNINSQAQGLNNEEIASTKYKDVIEQFSAHLQGIERICVDLSHPSYEVFAMLNADTIKNDIARIRSEIDLAFKTFCITSMTFLNDFLAAWKKENKDDMTMIMSAVLRSVSVPQNQVNTGPWVEYTDNLNSNSGTIDDLQGGFNASSTGPRHDNSSNFWNAMSGRQVGNFKYTNNTNSNSGHISRLSGGFNSNNHTYTTHVGANHYGSYMSNNANGNTGSNSIIIGGNSKKIVRMRTIGN